MNNDQPTEPITPESIDRVNPLAGHPLLQKRLDIDGDEICGPEVQSDAETKPVLVGADFGTVEAQVMAAVAKPAKFVVPHNISEADLKAVIDRLQKETKLPFEIVRAAVPEITKEVPAILRSHQGWMHAERSRQESRLTNQVIKALEIIKAAKRPVKLGYIENQINEPIFRALEPALNSHSNVHRKTHKNTVYYTWKD